MGRSGRRCSDHVVARVIARPGKLPSTAKRCHLNRYCSLFSERYLGPFSAGMAPRGFAAIKAMLSLSSVSKHFGGLRVLEDLDLIIPERGIFGLIGPNGAGKT